MNATAVTATCLLLFASGCDSTQNAPPQQTSASAAAVAPSAVVSATSLPAPTETASATPPATAKGPFPESTNPALRDPDKAKETAPATFKVKFETTQGDVELECKRASAPNGVDRFYNLIKIGFFDDSAFFRVVKEPKPFVVQFGIHGNPDVSKLWKESRLKPDKVKDSNKRGTLTYAMSGSPDTRTTQLFINLADNEMLDKQGFSPICTVTGKGMDVVDKLESSYGNMPSQQQPEIQSQGNKFLRQRYPRLDYVKTARLAGAK